MTLEQHAAAISAAIHAAAVDGFVLSGGEDDEPLTEIDLNAFSPTGRLADWVSLSLLS